MSAETPAEPGLARQVLADLRPQAFGRGSPWRIPDPIVEPLWVGVRALAAVDDGEALLVDADGDPIEDLPAIVGSLATAAPGDRLVIDGFLTTQATRSGTGFIWPDEMPSVSRLVLGHRRSDTDATAQKEAAFAARTFTPDDDVAFVVIDLLWLDGSSLLDVPLLERRRILEGVLFESDVVRLGAFVRPPIDRWAASWRVQGFTGITFKAANSRYLPGVENPDWAVGGMPRR
jgi:hypothetical protein